MKTKLFFVLPLLLFFFASSCNEDDTMTASQELFKRDMNANKPGNKTIFELAVASNLTELYGAILYVDDKLGTNLEATIQSNEVQLTVFAPTNNAFANLLSFLNDVREEEINDITDIPAEIVLAVLQYHLVEGRRASNSVLAKNANNKTIETLFNGATFAVDKSAMIYTAGGTTAQIGGGGAPFDVSASNGVVHVIDAVLLPLTPAEVLALWDALIQPE